MIAHGERSAYDAILVVGFGGPERREDVMPFLENVTRGRNIPRQRLVEVAEHYYHQGGASPINSQVRALVTSLRAELDRRNRPADLLGQSKLDSLARRYLGRDDQTETEAGAGGSAFRIHLLLQLPSIS